MRKVLALALVSWAIPIACAQPAPAQGATPAHLNDSGDPAWLHQLDTWRAQRDREMRAPDGWLTLVGLDWLKSGVNSVGGAADNSIRIRANLPDHIGLLTVSGATIQLLAPPGGFPQDLTVDGKPAREGPLSTDDANPSTMVWRSITMIVLARGSRYALRVKDAQAPTLTAFRGLHWFAPNPAFRITARWIPFNPPRTLKIPTIVGTTLDLPAPGIAEFTLHGKTLQLEPVIEDPHDSTLFFILRDATSQTTTYQAARFLRTPFPDHGLTQPGMLILDFNQLYNPPCAYTPYATCPLPPDQNRLAVPLTAGEQRYSH